MKKMVIIDSGFITHRSILAWGAQKKRQIEGETKNNFILPSSYIYFMSCQTILKKIGITRDDIVIVARDGRNSWRKAFYQKYKGTREEGRAKQSHINWSKHFADINNMEIKLNNSTDWHFILLDKTYNFADLLLTKEGNKFNIEDNGFGYNEDFCLEADDIQAVACKLFPNYEIVLVTIDQDLDQLTYYENVKIFNPNIKYKSKKGFYRIVEDPIGVLESKIRKGDVSDNIIVDKKNDTEKESEIRRVIIDLLDLPQFVVDPIESVLLNLKPKEIQYNILPCQNSLGKRDKYDLIYETKNIVSWDRSVLAHDFIMAKRKESQRKSYEKQKAKRKALREKQMR